MKIFIILFLTSLYITAAHADIGEQLQQLQHRANVAYAQMMSAKKEAENLQRDATFAERELEATKKRLADVERSTEAARQKSVEANKKLERATSHWKEASENLDREWLQSGRK